MIIVMASYLRQVFCFSGVLADEMYCFCLVLVKASTSLEATLGVQSSKSKNH